MEFCFDEAVKVLEAIVGALNGGSGTDYPSQVSRRRIRRAERQDFGETLVRVKKHVRPPVRADPEKAGYQSPKKSVTDNEQTIHFQKQEENIWVSLLQLFQQCQP